MLFTDLQICGICGTSGRPNPMSYYPTLFFAQASPVAFLFEPVFCLGVPGDLSLSPCFCADVAGDLSGTHGKPFSAARAKAYFALSVGYLPVFGDSGVLPSRRRRKDQCNEGANGPFP